MPNHIQALQSYRAQLIPAHIDASDVETAAEMRLLPEVRLKAPSCAFAMRAAGAVMGLPVHSVERIEPADALAA